MWQTGICFFLWLACASAALEVVSVRELGVVGRPAGVSTRDAGVSARIGGQILWVFGDTIFNPKSEDGTNLRSNSAALADPRSPLQVREPVDGQGAPYQALRFTGEERRYNRSTGNPNDRIALWIVGLVPDAQGQGLAFFSKLQVKPGFLNYHHLGVGTARFAPGQTTARRDAELLFGVDEPHFCNAFRHGERVYLYGRLPEAEGIQPYGIARAPLDRARERRAYTFWNGTAWVTEVAKTAKIIDGIPGEMTVSWNAHLACFIAVHSRVLDNRVLLHTAPRPEGPWSEGTVLFTGKPPTGKLFNYAGREHAELSREKGRVIYLTYYHPEHALRGELRMVEVRFR